MKQVKWPHIHFAGIVVMSTSATYGAPVRQRRISAGGRRRPQRRFTHYSQPMLGMMAADFHAGVADAGMVPTLTQLGYALGILLLAPLGDRYDRRRIILIKGVLLTLTLLLCAFSASFPLLLLSSSAIGLTATVAQDIIPAAATLAPEASRGKTVGAVMTGLLAGILLSRVQRRARRVRRLAQRLRAGGAGRFADHAGDLAMLPPRPHNWSYPRTAALAGATCGPRIPSCGAQRWRKVFSVIGLQRFWSTLALMLAERYQIGSAAAGAARRGGGALAAPLAGSLADRHGPDAVTRIGAGLVPPPSP